jgi:hypothetical protein
VVVDVDESAACVWERLSRDGEHAPDAGHAHELRAFTLRVRREGKRAERQNKREETGAIGCGWVELLQELQR